MGFRLSLFRFLDGRVLSGAIPAEASSAHGTAGARPVTRQDDTRTSEVAPCRYSVTRFEPCACVICNAPFLWHMLCHPMASFTDVLRREVW